MELTVDFPVIMSGGIDVKNSSGTVLAALGTLPMTSVNLRGRAGGGGVGDPPSGGSGALSIGN